jgi:hypothetical protein
VVRHSLMLGAIDDRGPVVDGFGAGWNPRSNSLILSAVASGERSDESILLWPRSGVLDEKRASSIDGNDRGWVRISEQRRRDDIDFFGSCRWGLRRTGEPVPGSVGAGVADRSGFRRGGQTRPSDIGRDGQWLGVSDRSGFTSDEAQTCGSMGGQLRNGPIAGTSAE